MANSELRDIPMPEANWVAACEVLLKQEELLRYKGNFGAFEALALGNKIARYAGEYDRGVMIEITRATDGMTLFQWSMDDKAPRNEIYIAGKREAVIASGACSLRCYVEYCLNGSWAEMARNDSSAMFAGGAFPIRVGNELKAIISTSGLHEGKDHELVVRALCAAMRLEYGVDVPAYNYPAI